MSGRLGSASSGPRESSVSEAQHPTGPGSPRSDPPAPPLPLCSGVRRCSALLTVSPMPPHSGNPRLPH
eukprot:700549-Hanusia_phi.AAC.1